MHHRWIIIFLISLAAGCASSSGGLTGKDKAFDEAVAQHNAAAAPENKVTCRRVRELGSNFARKVCKTNQEVERDLENAREGMEQIRSTTNRN